MSQHKEGSPAMTIGAVALTLALAVLFVKLLPRWWRAFSHRAGRIQ